MTQVRLAQSKTDYEFSMPLAIIGGGACGLVAGLAAHSMGVEAVILERDEVPRGSTFMSSGFIPAANTRFQKQAGVTDSAARMGEDIQGKNGYQADPDIVAALATASGGVIEWLADSHGIPFELVEGFLYPGHTRMRMHCTPRRTGEELMSCLLTAVENAGIPLLTGAQVTRLHVDENRTVTGVEYQRPDGATEELGCSALLLACNGYGGNPALVEKLIPEMKDALYFGHEGNQGDALLWGEALGASMKDLGAYQGHGSLAWPHQTLISWAVMMQGGIQLNQNGERFSNEHGGYSEQAAKVLGQPGQIAYNVFDGRIHAECLRFEDYKNAHSAGAVKVFDSLESMAAALDMPLEQLRSTFKDIDELGASEQPDAFGRVFRQALRLEFPLHVIKVTGALFHTQGGLEINAEGQVLDQQGQPLPNLYAAGGAARGVSGSGGSGYLSGNGLLSAVVMGAIAGRSAAAKAG